MRQLRISLDAPDLVGDNLPDLVLDAVVVGINLLLHGVVAVLVGEVDDLRYLHVAGGLPLDLLVRGEKRSVSICGQPEKA